MSPELLPANMRTKIELRPCPVAELPGPCWHWTRGTNGKNYGCVGVNGKSELTHRVSYTLLVGPIPDGLQIDHLCRNTRCCNPAHLEPVTGKVNQERSARATKTHCIRNHELSGHNLMIRRRSNGRTERRCRTCQYELQRRARRQPTTQLFEALA